MTDVRLEMKGRARHFHFVRNARNERLHLDTCSIVCQRNLCTARTQETGEGRALVYKDQVG